MKNTKTKNKCYKYCVVPQCKNTTVTAPDKLFFPLPTEKRIRAKWCKIMKRRDPLAQKTVCFCCEDHFDVETDTKNFIRYKLMGGGLFLKQDVFPHKFECQTVKYTDDRPSAKRLRLYFCEELTEDQDTQQPTEFIECVPEDDEIKRHEDPLVEPIEYLNLEIDVNNKIKLKKQGLQITIPPQEYQLKPSKTRHLLPTQEERLKFVREIIKHRPSLVTDSKYETKTRKRKRQIALIKVSKKMNIPGFGPREVYSNIRSFKSTYLRELKKIKNAAARGRKYVPDIIWFETMDNAIKALTVEESVLCQQNENTESSLEMDEETSHSEDIEEQSINTQFIEVEYLEDEEQMNSNSETETRDNVVGNIDNAEYADDIESNDTENRKNEFDIFGESVAAQLINMTLPDALEAQLFIQNYLSNLRLQGQRRQLQ